MTTLFDPIQLGAVGAANRILMAPLTRGRATRAHVPTPIMADYYAQRASAGLIISEATGISQQGLGWPYAPGIWSDEQVAAWQPVTQAVHVICPLLSGPESLLFWIMKEFGNGQEAQAGRDYRQAA